MSEVARYERIDGIGPDPERTKEVVAFAIANIIPDIEDLQSHLTSSLFQMKTHNFITLIGRTVDDQIVSTISACLIEHKQVIHADLTNMAVEQDSRDGYIGRQTVGLIEALVRPRGAAWAQLTSRESAVGFWDKMGYAHFDYVNSGITGEVLSLRTKKLRQM